MQIRRRFKQTQSLEKRLAQQAIKLRHQADCAKTPLVRDRLIRMARHFETASHMNEWLASPGLRPPT
jgi:hypothetical protein